MIYVVNDRIRKEGDEMKKKMILILSAVIGLTFLGGCGSNEKNETAYQTEVSTEVEITDDTNEEASSEAVEEEETTEAKQDGSDDQTVTKEASESDTEWSYGEYKYTGDDGIINAIDQYLVAEIGKYYDKADVGIPYMLIVDRDESDSEDIKVWGAFWYENYDMEGDTLISVSGGSHPGCMHLKKTDAEYVVTEFEQVADGSDYEESAKEIFGDRYDQFSATYSDDDKRNAERKAVISDFVKSHNVPVTKYQDYGWDPVNLD